MLVFAVSVAITRELCLEKALVILNQDWLSSLGCHHNPSAGSCTLHDARQLSCLHYSTLF